MPHLFCEALIRWYGVPIKEAATAIQSFPMNFDFI